MASFVSANGKPCTDLGNVDGVRIAGFMFEAGTEKQILFYKLVQENSLVPKLTQFVLSDVFARSGGDKKDNTAISFVTINSDNVIIVTLGSGIRL
jgi:hypothetical protein